MNYLLTKHPTDHVITESESNFALRATTQYDPQQYTDALIARSWKVADVDDESTVSDVFKEGVYASIRHILRNYSAENSQADMTYIAFPVGELWSTEKHSRKKSNVQLPNTNPAKPYSS